MKVLVADDESIIRMGLKSMLQEMDYAVITARDGQEALQKAIKYQPDVAVLDIQMPKTNGLQLAKALNKHFPLPIIFLTAFAQDELIDRATDLNVQGYLIKPVKSAELRATIQIACKRFRDPAAGNHSTPKSRNPPNQTKNHRSRQSHPHQPRPQ